MRDVAGLIGLDGVAPTPAHVRAMLGPVETGTWQRRSTAVGTWAWSAEGPAPGAAEFPPPVVEGEITVLADARIDAGFPPPAHPHDGDDTAVARIARALGRWGAGAVDHLVGDFAFAAGDGETVLLGRDGMSMRPLYFSHADDGILRFASAVGVLRDGLGRPGPVDRSAVAAFLTGAQLPPGRSFFSDVLRVPPGAVAVITGSGEIDVVCRSTRPPDPGLTGPDDAEEALWSLLRTAVRDRLPAGDSALMLSGGADSAGVCLALASLGPEWRDRCTAFTWTFDELADADESARAQRVAELAGLCLKDVPGDDAWPLRDLEASRPDEDSPFVWPFQALNQRTLRAARTRGATVLLTGDRGDYVIGDWVYGDGRTLDPPPVPAYLTRHLADEARDLHARAGPMLDAADGELRRKRIADWGGAQIAEMNARAFRRAGLGYADPWADRRIVDLVSALPPAWVNRRDDPKRILRRILSSRGLPPDDAEPRSQLSLFVRGIRERESGTVRALWNDAVASQLGFVDEAVVRRAVDRYVSGQSLEFDLWKPIALELWLRRVHGVPLP